MQLPIIVFIPFATTALAALGAYFIFCAQQKDRIVHFGDWVNPGLTIGLGFILGWLLSIGLIFRLVKRIKVLALKLQQGDIGGPDKTSGPLVDGLAAVEQMVSAVAVQFAESRRREQIALAYAVDAESRDESAGQRLHRLTQTSQISAQRLMNEMPAGLLLIAADGTIRFANDAAAAMTGKTSASLVGQPVAELFSGVAVQSSIAFVQLMLENARSYVADLTVESGTVARVQLRASRLRMDDGADELVLLTIVNCTDSNRFEEAKHRLIAMIVHDIATPLASINGVLAMASSGMFGPLRPSLCAELERAQRDSKNLLGALGNIVNFQKLVADSESIAATDVALKHLTQEALAAAQTRIQERKLQVVDLVEPDVRSVGDADKLALLAARLLDMIVAACTETASITLSAIREPAFVGWVLKVEGDPKISERLQPFMDESDLFDVDHRIASYSFDVILWRLLLYQCGGRLSHSIFADGCTMILRLPSFDGVAQAAMSGQETWLEF